MKKIGRIPLPIDWHFSEEAVGVDCARPGIYLWTIGGVGVYVGKYKHIRRPRTEYRRNVEHLLNGDPYRKNKPDQFRKIHRALADAVRTKKSITLTILENPKVEDIGRRERELIRELGKKYGSLNG